MMTNSVDLCKDTSGIDAVFGKASYGISFLSRDTLMGVVTGIASKE